MQGAAYADQREMDGSAYLTFAHQRQPELELAAAEHIDECLHQIAKADR